MENISAHNTPTSNRSHHPYNGNHSVSGGGGREDCWSEGATATLIDAWGDRYLQLSRGNLRQKDWKEVADAVNSRQDSIKKPRKTDVQCKNRIDTIKKKYKLERSKPLPSKWPFYSHLDQLIGTPNVITPKLKPPPPPLPQHPSSSSPVNFSVRKLNPNPNPNPNHYNSSAVIYSGGSSSKSRLNSSPFGSTGSSHDGDDDEDEEDLMVDIGVGGGGSRSRSRKSNGVIGNSVPNDDGEAFREIAKAIVKFGEVYERIESSKQQQIMELERQRMEFTKDLEFQRMQMFMEAQLELEKTKRPKYAPGAGKKQ
ncbi:hypothetical protein AQUCO_04500192v1 [Aquilegia coerulea]|uniref:Myb/SANT-like DNA-binding domain-containing protein n=1 Tax=Aquilegia coerulea TaxID=218851 RepID=A0A2G5CMF1_AQUCA|nr:hypothetical protein AQUCO_04500192v1 [Aquilegia coerulea]